jgi:uncharacterized metal-binding protein YceD (DUF177 family)
MNPSEFPREFNLRSLPDDAVILTATPEERAALARRFGLVSIHSLEAVVTLAPDGQGVAAQGRLSADIVQSCAISGEDLPVGIDEPLALRFVPERAVAEDEIELEAEELDEITFSGTSFDLGEAVAQTLALSIDPYATGPQAEEIRRTAGLSTPEASGPFAALAALKKS